MTPRGTTYLQHTSKNRPLILGSNLQLMHILTMGKIAVQILAKPEEKKMILVPGP